MTSTAEWECWAGKAGTLGKASNVAAADRSQAAADFAQASNEDGKKGLQQQLVAITDDYVVQLQQQLTQTVEQLTTV